MFIDPLVSVIPGQSGNSRRHVVFYRQPEKKRVQVDVVRGPPDLEMEMGPLRSAGIAAPGDLLALFDRKERRRNRQIDGPGLLPVLLLFNIGGQRRDEVVEMAIYCRIAIGMTDVNRLSESERSDLHPCNITVRSRVNREVLPVLGSDIETHMVVVGAKLAEIRGQAHGNPQRVAEINLGIPGGDEK